MSPSREVAMQDPALELDVIEELAWDPRIDATAVGVDAEEGTVTLRGTVSSLRHRRDAVKVARRVRGVLRLRDELEVRLPPAHRRDDTELSSDVLQALTLDTAVPTTVNAYAQHGVVTLMGFVDWHCQRLASEAAVANVLGVREVVDLIRLQPTGTADPVAFLRAARRAGLPSCVSLEATDGTVTVNGAVHTLSDHDRALALAWSTPGTVAVNDRLSVVPA
ncbi:BON domain-containing protein [Streptomyces sp. NPDC047081]|uniref:BON domain-containing protein n=1 Tax=Streptomyces sp. NPDC047081 TaxID=3154706 RepID=UPI0033D752D4